jgi:superfamily II DNA or RNA helicase
MIAKREVLPTQWNDFNNFFVDTIQQSIKNKSKFQNRISGLLSYYGAYYSKDKDTNREDFPKGLPIEFIKVPMSSYQYNLYRIAREREINESNIKNDTGNTLVKPKGLFNSSYKRLSRQWSNFAFPKDALTIGKQVQLFSDEVDDADIKNLAMYSPKWKRMIEQLNKDHGKSLVYSSFVENAGISMFARALINHGWEEYDSKSKSNKSFIIITGDVVPEDRYDLIDKFNSKSNILGNEIKLIMISGAGAEGIDLNCVQNVHIMEPYWNWMRISQVRGRAIRYKSHIMLPLAERIVNTYIYLSDYPEKLDKQDDIKKFEEFSTDNTLLATSIKMNKINNAFYQAMAESSIDCVINNKNSQLKCRLCAPTNEMLYINDIYKDMSIRSPCRMPKTKDTEATEVLLDGKKYAYIKGDIYTILEYREDLEGYVELDPNSVLYGIIREELK